AGALGGSGITRKSEGRVHNGMLSIYLDPAVLDTEGSFARDVHDYVQWIKSSTPLDAEKDVLIPGDKERRTAAERTAQGLPLPDDVWSSILAAARLVGLDEARIAALTA
ncbi:MAG TPA: Ldh family oxidoreductase, partial [Geminicoccaceae bacterium]|nr:Ldh family oxidoreductase [Geminicoccaceae bacterium]